MPKFNILVMFHVFRACHYQKIRDSIIRPILVFVMDNFRRFKLPFEMSFHNISMLKNFFTINKQNSISITHRNIVKNPNWTIHIKSVTTSMIMWLAEFFCNNWSFTFLYRTMRNVTSKTASYFKRCIHVSTIFKSKIMCSAITFCYNISNALSFTFFHRLSLS